MLHSMHHLTAKLTAKHPYSGASWACESDVDLVRGLLSQLGQEHAERSGFPATVVTEVSKIIDPTTANG
jgi:hypothetical protein